MCLLTVKTEGDFDFEVSFFRAREFIDEFACSSGGNVKGNPHIPSKPTRFAVTPDRCIRASWTIESYLSFPNFLTGKNPKLVLS